MTTTLKTRPGEGAGVRYRREVRLTPADVGQRAVVRWRRLARGDGEAVAGTATAEPRRAPGPLAPDSTRRSDHTITTTPPQPGWREATAGVIAGL